MNNIKPQMNPEEMFHMFDLKVLGDKIFYFKNVISFPKELMNTITDLDLNDQLSYKRIPQWNPWTASDDPNTIYGATKTILKNSTKIDTGSEYTNKRTLYIINSLIMAVEMCTEKYFSSLGMDQSLFNLEIDQLQIKKWNTGQSMGPHFDGQDGHTELAYSLVTYLNDDYEGGEIHFKNHNITLKPDAGSLIIFPSQEPYIHEVKPIISGTRYMSPASIYKK